jgi:S-adenosylmethionine:tRNA ribosyltransferase-isomerase
MKTARLDYPLPESLIATHPVEPRDACRLLVCWRSQPGRIEHRRFSDLPDYLGDSDTLVFNTTSVLPARIRGRRTDSSGAVGGLFLAEREPGLWRVMLRSNGKLRAGQRIALLDQEDRPCYAIELIEREQEGWLVWVDAAGVTDPVEILDRVGGIPLPPYIDRARLETGAGVEQAEDRAWYQTVYADPTQARSVAAPTAGLHFTEELLGAIARKGTARADLLLHVGAGTFKPIEAEDLSGHTMHEEFYEIPSEAARSFLATRERGGRLVMVGTTAVRSAENLTDQTLDQATQEGLRGSTDLFITPGYRFRWTDALVTNFHLPRSTLLALVGALLETGAADGLDRLLEIYRIAIEEKYRFFSYGDAMLVLP